MRCEFIASSRTGSIRQGVGRELLCGWRLLFTSSRAAEVLARLLVTAFEAEGHVPAIVQPQRERWQLLANRHGVRPRLEARSLFSFDPPARDSVGIGRRIASCRIAVAHEGEQLGVESEVPDGHHIDNTHRLSGAEPRTCRRRRCGAPVGPCSPGGRVRWPRPASAHGGIAAPDLTADMIQKFHGFVIQPGADPNDLHLGRSGIEVHFVARGMGATGGGYLERSARHFFTSSGLLLAM